MGEESQARGVDDLVIDKDANESRLSFGVEIELGDVSRGVAIPPSLGEWEYAETDVVNQKPPYRGRACDPLGIDPPVGGEINVMPSRTVAGLIGNVSGIFEHLARESQSPTLSFVSGYHVHVRVAGLRNNITELKQVASWIKRHQAETVRLCWGYRESPGMERTRTARTYMKFDGGRLMPNWMLDNILAPRTKSFGDFIRMHCCGKDGASRGRPFRYAINTYSLKHIDTIEFRCFRMSLDLSLLESPVVFAREAVLSMLRGDLVAPADIAKSHCLSFQPMLYDHELYVAWERTKYDVSRGMKRRTLRECR